MDRAFIFVTSIQKGGGSLDSRRNAAEAFTPFPGVAYFFSALVFFLSCSPASYAVDIPRQMPSALLLALRALGSDRIVLRRAHNHNHSLAPSVPVPSRNLVP